MEQVFNDCLAEHKAEGATVLLSSHILSEVDRTADRVTIIRDGRAVETGTLAELRHLRSNRVVAQLAGPVPDIASLSGVDDVSVDGQTVTCLVGADHIGAVVAALSSTGVRSLTCTPPTLEELFLDVYRTRTAL